MTPLRLIISTIKLTQCHYLHVQKSDTSHDGLSTVNHEDTPDDVFVSKIISGL